ncbi:Stk1 family PASTA domain-containing Ser/Thr kinase [Bacillus sp. B15-48]|uniref:Stk1 family PASTA domain-containing Ser/Thr kinase n=1 Tax=Bacillus sp. B15-48 TaxID=1548601 RepID=UPI00193F1BFB|nr:Stk1 family PASTA domain-containing Ser/Thr kinase [Bacillus sp. B15-48]MBM4763976.1 Stk1 family PASTA domain-containing Ser/Thr kinase [Bacillus sp. B15-48]
MMIGKRISGRYKILDMIGGGGMANVYLAHDMILDRDVAVKMLRLDFANDEEFIRRFHREAQSATSLTNENIVSIYDVGEEDGLYYIVMEYVAGQTLKQYIQQSAPIPVEKALDIMKQLTSAIAHAHQNQIIHRDIKPHNILIDDEGNVKITDFGIAMALSATSITQTNSVLGSVHYLSPEQARGGMANHKSDIYSLGIVMFELLTGRLPFSGESAVSIALKHLQSETPSIRRWNPNIPQSVENIVLTATAKDPFHRYDDVYEMEDDLRTALDPSRLNEEKFTIPIDYEATKAIPIISDDGSFDQDRLDETIVHSQQEKETNRNDQIEKAKINKLPKKKKRKKWPFVLTSVFVLLLLAGIFLVFIAPDLFGPDDIPVPDVEGMTVDQAVTELLTAGFVIGDQKEVNDDQIDEGLLVRTNPRAGRIVKEGTEIDLFISAGKKRFELSDYRNRLYDDVLRLLEKHDFKDIIKVEEHDESEPGTILNQIPSGGELIIPSETVLEFKVSKGPELISLTDLKGYTAKSLKDYENMTGIRIQITEQFHDTVAEGLVFSQNPAEGTQLKKGSQVNVIISKGKEEVPLLPKEVTEEIAILYDENLDGEPQLVQIFIEDMDNNINTPAIEYEITETKNERLTFRIAPGGKAVYRIITNDQVFFEDEVYYPED